MGGVNFLNGSDKGGQTATAIANYMPQKFRTSTFVPRVS